MVSGGFLFSLLKATLVLLTGEKELHLHYYPVIQTSAII